MVAHISIEKSDPLKQSEAFLESQISLHKTPGLSYIFFRNGTPLCEFHMGWSSIARSLKINKNTSFNLYSITKTFTALAILQLAEQGAISLDHSAQNYFTGFPYSSLITVRHLLTHTSGIPNPIPLSWIHLASEHPSFDRNAFFIQVFQKNKQLKSKPGDKFAYSNLNYVLLGQILEHITGKDYEQVIHDNIIKKLELNPSDLGFTITDSNKHATGYQKRRSFANLLLGMFINKSKFMGQSEKGWLPFKSIYVNGPFYGGLIGTAKGLISYLHELMIPDSSLVSTACKQQLFTENSIRKNPTGMCMSWFKDRLNDELFYTHAGGGGGYYSELRLYPEWNACSVLLCNRTGMSDERLLNKTDEYFINSMK